MMPVSKGWRSLWQTEKIGGVWGGKVQPAQLQGKPVLSGCLSSPKENVCIKNYLHF